MTDVTVTHLSRRFGAFVALDDVSFSVRSGEFVTLLGPSGCGKSTTLAALAGLDRPTAGAITVGSRAFFDSATGLFVDAQFRNIGLMFQSYALWPHMTVFKNLDFALELRKIRGAEARRRIGEALEMVDMGQFAHRYPGELSGGQQQRVALARTLVYRPEVLLLDEPLSNLDAKLRDRARLWLADLHRRTGVTMIYVTHDQAEALSLSDRIIVMNRGRIAQVGPPREIYERPADPFVADFVGASNLVPATLTRGRVVLGGDVAFAAASDGMADGRVLLSIRPETVEMDVAEAGENTAPYRLVSASYLGSRTLLVAEIGGQRLRVEAESRRSCPERGFLRIPRDAIRVFAAPAEAEAADPAAA